MIFGKEKNKGIRLNGLKLEVVTIGENGITEESLLVHDAYEVETTLHLMLIRMALPEFPVALGVIREVATSVYEDVLVAQIEQAQEKSKYKNLDDFFASGEVWEVK